MMESSQSKEQKYVPEIKGALRNHLIEMPAVIRNASGIKYLVRESNP